MALYPISTHAPLAGRDDKLKALSLHADISTHAPLAGRDSRIRWWSCPTQNFNPRAPCGARRKIIRGLQGGEEISTHAPLAGRDEELVSFWSDMLGSISTHAPLAGRDSKAQDSRGRVRNFNPRAPCGARPCWPAKSTLPQRFQPTRPLRGATQSTEESDVYQEFQPTRPLRGATASAAGRDATDDISTHAPLAGRDDENLHQAPRGRNFNPRAPCGARPRGATCGRGWKDFNPRAPCGARLYVAFKYTIIEKISTHAPLAGRDGWPRSAGRTIYFISTHAPLAGRDICKAFREQNYAGISTHAPLAGRDSKSVQITMHIFAITDKFQMLLHRMPPVRAFCSFLMQENHADFGCEPPK